MDEPEHSTPEPDETRGKSRTAILILASLLSAAVLMAPTAGSALVCLDDTPNPCPILPGFNISADVDVQIRQIGDPSVLAENRVQAADQSLIDISAPLSLPVGGATLSGLATFRSVVIPTSSGGLISFGTAEATTIIDPLLVTDPAVFPAAFAGFVIRFDSGNTPVAVAMSVINRVTGAELAFDPLDSEVSSNTRSGGVLFRPADGMDFGIAGAGFYQPKPGDLSFAFSTVVKPNRTINFSIDDEVIFQYLVNLSPNFRDSRID